MEPQQTIDLAQKLLKKGDAFYSEDRMDDALTAWEEAVSLYTLPQLADRLDLDEDRAALQENRGFALSSLGRRAEALAAYEAGLTLYALPHLAKKPELNKNHAFLLEIQGLELEYFERDEDALESYETALTLYALPHLVDRSELDKDRARLQSARGDVLFYLNRNEEALDAYGSALSLHALPHLADSPELDEYRAHLQRKRGNVLVSLKRHEEALKVYESAQALLALPHLADRPELDKGRVFLLMNWGVTLNYLGCNEEALEVYESAQALLLSDLSPELDGLRAGLQMDRGNALSSLGRLEEGLDAYESALTLYSQPHLADGLERDENRANLQMNLVGALNSLGRHEESLKAHESGLALLNQPHLANRPGLDKTRAGLQINRGNALDSLGRHEEALNAYESALTLHDLPHLAIRPELDVDRATVQMNRSNALRSLGRHEEALDADKSALTLHALPHLADRPELDRDRAMLQGSRSSTLLFLGQYEEAFESCESGLSLLDLPHLADHQELDVYRARLQINRGNALRSLGRLGETLEAYESAHFLLVQPHLVERNELDSDRALLYANMANLLPEISDRNGFTDMASGQLAAMLELAPLPVKNQYDSFQGIRKHFVRFHSLWLHYAIEQGWEDDIPRIMATIQGRDLAARMLDELESPDGETVAPGAVRRYQQARLSLRKLRAQIDRIVNGGLSTSTENDDSRSRLIQGAPISPGQDALNPQLDRLREQYQAAYRELHKLRRAAAEEPGYGVLGQPHRQITLNGLQSSLARDEALVLLLDREESAKKREADGSALKYLGTGAIPNVERESPRRRRRVRRNNWIVDVFVLFVSFVVKTLLRRRFSSATLRTVAGTKQEQPFHAMVIRGTGQRLISLPNLGPALKQMDSYLASQGRKLAGATQTPSGRFMASYRRGAEIGEERHSRAASGFTAGKQRLGDKAYTAFWQTQAEHQSKHLWEPLSEALDGITTVITLSHGRLHGLPLEAGLPVDMRLRSYPGVVFYAGRRGLLGDALKPAEVSYAAESPAQPLGVLAYPGEGDKKIPRVEDEVQWVWQLYNHDEPLQPYPLQKLPPAVESLHIASHGVPDKHGQVALLVGKNETLDMGRILEQQIRAKTVYLGCCLAGQTVEDLDGEPTGLVTGFFLRGTKVLHGAVVEVNDEWAPLLGILYQRELRAGKASEMAMERAKEILRSGEWEPEEFGDLAPKIEALYQKRRIPPEPILGDLLYGMRTFGEG